MWKVWNYLNAGWADLSWAMKIVIGLIVFVIWVDAIILLAEVAD